MQFFQDTKIDFVSKRSFFAVVSAIVILVGVIGTVVIGPKLGIDFAGGTEVAVKFFDTVEIDDLRKTVEKAGFDGAEIKSFGQANQYLIRVKESGNESEIMVKIFKQDFPDAFKEDGSILKLDKIGPKIGDELFGDAIIAVLLAVISILLYIAFRFEFVYGFGAIVALVHDVVVTFTLIVIANYILPINLEINQAILAGMLTVVGYSINDTVIIFDRIRENLDVHKGMNYFKLVNMSINETLSRTVNTTLTSSLVLVTLLLFGGPVLQGFAFTMLIGIITGTYSSIYVASSFVIFYREKIKKEDLTIGSLKAKKTKTVKA